MRKEGAERAAVGRRSIIIVGGNEIELPAPPATADGRTRLPPSMPARLHLYVVVVNGCTMKFQSCCHATAHSQHME